MSLEPVCHGREEVLDLPFRPLGMDQDPAIGKVLSIAGDLKPPGHGQHLGPEADALHSTTVPGVGMGDMG
jgi:hypothetical protein